MGGLPDGRQRLLLHHQEPEVVELAPGRYVLHAREQIASMCCAATLEIDARPGERIFVEDGYAWHGAKAFGFCCLMWFQCCDPCKPVYLRRMSRKAFLQNVRASDANARRAAKLLKGLRLFMSVLSAAGTACDFAEGFGEGGFGAGGVAAGIENATATGIDDVLGDMADDAQERALAGVPNDVEMAGTMWARQPLAEALRAHSDTTDSRVSVQ